MLAMSAAPDSLLALNVDKSTAGITGVALISVMSNFLGLWECHTV
jgi:hypothetical protein